MSEHKRNPNTVCLVCKKPIYRRRFQLEQNGNRVFCSSTCYGLAQRKEKPCVVCGKPILASKNKKTCSHTCSNIHRTGMRYKLLEPRKDKVHHYKVLKLRLLKQRGVTCERCGYAKFEILQVHHKDGDHQNNELSNLELICPNCHYEEHLLEKSWLRKRKKYSGEL